MRKAANIEDGKQVRNVDYRIREYEAGDDPAMRQCVIALQDFERTIDPRLRPGTAMAAAYCERIHSRCRAAGGRVFVAEENGTVVGLVVVLAREKYTELDDPPGSVMSGAGLHFDKFIDLPTSPYKVKTCRRTLYALVSDLVVLPAYQRRGIGRQLLEHAEAYARSAGATELRIGVLAQNAAARRMYLDAEFVPQLEIFSKPL